MTLVDRVTAAPLLGRTSLSTSVFRVLNGHGINSPSSNHHRYRFRRRSTRPLLVAWSDHLGDRRVGELRRASRLTSGATRSAGPPGTRRTVARARAKRLIVARHTALHLLVGAV